MSLYRSLFEIAAFAIPGWLLLIFLPNWSVTRRVARSAIFPAFLALLYVVGIITSLTSHGFGVLGEFGSADGVMRILAREDIAMLAWIHILAFDQVVGMVIYRDNMHYRYVPLVVQSVILFLTFMFGPVGFLTYLLLRLMRPRAAAQAGS